MNTHTLRRGAAAAAVLLATVAMAACGGGDDDDTATSWGTCPIPPAPQPGPGGGLVVLPPQPVTYGTGAPWFVGPLQPAPAAISAAAGVQLYVCP